ncbi:hypothetical protein B0A48_13533 [Cryoendolithus antarcticus]|uniref:EXPERA domain-containing protein n=1 Tax=Cryoendolithus antarcticus TaxID=1507870 RepID=A0A1V8SNU6_9PEZI|nr:hypothetical protein B0A48_13533 [Cryoendolithus antarcticus]
MVATRNHPKPFDATSTLETEPTPKPSPSKRTTRSSVVPEDTKPTQSPPKMSLPSTLTSLAPSSSTSPTKSRTLTTLPPRSTPTARSRWSHTPSNLTLLWLAISLPLVLWDTGYILLRPHTLPGRWLHAPIWTPYELYGRVDMVYSPAAYWNGLGFTGAQGTVNLVETAMYGVYLYIVYAYGKSESRQGRGAPDRESLGFLEKLGEARTLEGREAAVAVLIGYSCFVLTFAKTILYMLNEAYSGFEGVGHNDFLSLIFLWIIPNGSWIIFPLYFGYVFGAEIVQGLDAATGADKKRS